MRSYKILTLVTMLCVCCASLQAQEIGDDAIEAKPRNAKGVRAGNNNGLQEALAGVPPELDNFDKLVWAYENGTMPDPKALAEINLVIGDPRGPKYKVIPNITYPSYWKGVFLEKLITKNRLVDIVLRDSMFLAKVYSNGPLLPPFIQFYATSGFTPYLQYGALQRNRWEARADVANSSYELTWGSYSAPASFRSYNGLLIMIVRASDDNKCWGSDPAVPGICGIAYYYEQIPFKVNW